MYRSWSIKRNQQRSLKVCIHYHVIMISESRFVQLALSMESGIALLTMRKPCIHKTMVLWLRHTWRHISGILWYP
jgi:hypothetical protein